MRRWCMSDHAQWFILGVAATLAIEVLFVGGIALGLRLARGGKG
jgi:hypothetical protein